MAMAAGEVKGIMIELKPYDAPEAFGAVYQDAVKFPSYPKTAETIRRRAVGRLGAGQISPGPLTSVFCIELAGLTRNRKSLALASTQGQLGLSGVSRNFRRIFGPMGRSEKKRRFCPRANAQMKGPPAVGR